MQDGPVPLVPRNLLHSNRLPDLRVKECGVVTADTSHLQGILSPKAARTASPRTIESVVCNRKCFLHEFNGFAIANEYMRITIIYEICI